jgi:hypothetical protein
LAPSATTRIATVEPNELDSTTEERDPQTTTVFTPACGYPFAASNYLWACEQRADRAKYRRLPAAYAFGAAPKQAFLVFAT